MDSRLKITPDGGVFMYVPDEVVEILMGYQYDICRFVNDNPWYLMGIDDVNACIERGDELFVYVGDMRSFNFERSRLLGSLDSMASYIKSKHRIPWGVKGIIRQMAWKRMNEPGTSIAIDDGKRILRYWKKNDELRIENK